VKSDLVLDREGMPRAVRPIVLIVTFMCPLLFLGCSTERNRARPADPRPASAPGKRLTAQEFLLLSDAEKIAYRNVVLRIPEAWGGALLPFSG
jgi:hypothetical protein